MSELIISIVPITLVEYVWPKCITHFEKVISKAPHDLSLSKIKENLLSGRTMLLAVTEDDNVIAVNILEQITYETGHRVLSIPVVGGDRLGEWMERGFNIVHAIARDLNCDELRGMACRKGWLKALQRANQDWYEVHTTVGCKVKQIEEIV